ncbi:phosphopantetheine-binding protein, partial [Nocardia farcinica]|uniref:phosphopantetheine-binding protein n=1 Tax=Nocardia farcinica TaxID=37329 RepID=UPI003CC7CEEE
MSRLKANPTKNAVGVDGVSPGRPTRAPPPPPWGRRPPLCALALFPPRAAPDDDFFELGGNSLAATRVVA